MTVKLNGQLITQPSQLEEDVLPIQTDVQSLDGSMQRNFIGSKYQAKLSFSQLSISGYQQLIGLLNTGSGVIYYNDQTAMPLNPLTFSGLPIFFNYPYVNGASLWQQLDVTIRQV